MTTADAVAHGIKSTAGVVTSAAIVMVAVFSIFAILPEIMFKQLGVGLAVAVLIDATIVRAVLLPSAMTLLGDWNWYLPSWPALGPRRHAPHRNPHPGSGAARIVRPRLPRTLKTASSRRNRHVQESDRRR
jgi:hypothetical protein